jgi:type VI secretion system protein VasJ
MHERHEKVNLELLQGIGRQPVDATSAAGRDVRDDPRFEALQQEIGKLSSPGAEGQTDWPRVGQTAALLLAEKGKDLLVAGYLGAALLQGQGLAGLAVGLEVVGDLVEHFWEGMYPPVTRLRARRNAMQWLLDRTALDADEKPWSDLQPQPPELVERLLSAARRLDEALRDKDEDAPSLRPLIGLIERVPVAASAPAPPDAASVQTAVPAATATAASAAEATAKAARAMPRAPALPDPSADGAGIDALAPALEHLGRVADAMMSAGPCDALAYRISRFANWAAVDVLPPATGGLTQIAPPIAQVAAALQRMQDEGASPQDAIGFAEAQLPAFPLWLDLQALCADGLARLGGDGASALAEVERATRELLQRLSGLELLSFADGTPLANARTTQWIAALAVEPANSARAPAANPLHARNDDLNAAVSQARALIADGQVQPAAALMQQLINRAPEPATRLRAQIHLCRLLGAGAGARAATAFARLVVEQIRHHDLERWDPALALEGWAAAYDALLNQPDADPAARDSAFSAIARLDAARAVGLL